MRSIVTSEIGTWVAGMSATRSASVTRKSLGVLRQVLDLAVRDRRIVVNPAIGVTQPRLPLQDQRFLSADELEGLAEATPSDRDRLLVLTLGGSGCGSVRRSLSAGAMSTFCDGASV